MPNIIYTVIDAPPGPIFTAESRKGLIKVALGEEGMTSLVAFVRRWFPDHQIIPSVLDSANQIEAYLEGKLKKFGIPLDLKGTDFQKQVWRATKKIPFGQTRTYGQIAKEIGRDGAARAVGGALGCNPVALVVPCHRVLGAGGQLTGFASGLDWKQWLL